MPTMPGMTWRQAFFGFHGRMNRAAFLGCTVLASTASAVVLIPLTVLTTEEGGEAVSSPALLYALLAALVLGLIVCFVSNMALLAKRLHDLDFSAWHVLWIAPVLGSGSRDTPLAYVLSLLGFGLLVWLLITRGTDGPNRFGEPRIPPRDPAPEPSGA
jgi:uncharacterized membrane protein YhaH (DUF805 family)